MKNLFFLVIAVFLVVGSTNAQDYKKASKAAKSALNKFNFDQTNNQIELQNAVSAIEEAITYPEAEVEIDAWLLKGSIYNAVANAYKTANSVGLEISPDLPKIQNPGIEAQNAYNKAMKMAEKKGDINEVLEGMKTAQSNCDITGVEAFEAGDFVNAYENFIKVLQAHKTILENGGESYLNTEEIIHDQEYKTALSAQSAGMNGIAKNLFMGLYEIGYDNPRIYESLYSIEAENNLDEAYKYIEEGRSKYPDESSLLFADINHSLKTNQLDILLGKLADGIAAEPENISLYMVSGSVYEQLFSKLAKEGKIDDPQAISYFENSIANYSKALELKPDYSNAVYSIGAIYFNKAAIMSQNLESLSEDYSKAGIQKFNELLEKVQAEFEKALPYFQQSEAMDPNDMNTLIALKEIFARKNELDLSNEFKERLDKIQAGEKIEASYFKAN
jgi:hypothetical protein